MRIRYITNGRPRFRILTNDVENLTQIHKGLTNAGFRQVGLIRFWLHVITAGRRGFKPLGKRKQEIPKTITRAIYDNNAD